MGDAVINMAPVFSSLHRVTVCLVALIHNRGAGLQRRKRRRGFQITSGRSWNWSATDDGGGQVIETCGGLESVAVETETFSSSAVECAATSEAAGASCGEGTACEEAGALWESARL